MENQKVEQIKMDVPIAQDTFNTIAKQKVESFETLGELATALRPLFYLAMPQASKETELNAEIERLKAENEKLKEGKK